MERCDFSAIMSIIRAYIREDREMNQLDLVYMLFDTYISSDEGADFDFDNGLVCRWMNGQAKVSPRISGYYLDERRQRELSDDLRRNLLPKLTDSAMAVQKIYELVIRDESISERKKQELTKSYPGRSEQEDADLVTGTLCFGMSREFVKRDAHTKALASGGDLSPALAEFVLGGDVPKPCRHFCGRDRELTQMHEMLAEHGKVFLHGIAGIGKSEMAKAYAKQYKKEYTNTLYIPYSGDLKQDVTDLDFADDLPGESGDERFRRHNRFLRSLKADTLLIVDNFNTLATGDALLPVVIKYRCRILFTTRSRMEHYPSMELSEIQDHAVLLDLMGRYYSKAEKYQAELEQIINTVHGHTLAVELAARLLEHGILEPGALLQKLEVEKAALDSTDRITITKDGQVTKETYYGHIHTLFSLYRLSDGQLSIMRNMALMPPAGIPARRLAAWLKLPDLNEINDLIEAGLVQPLPGQAVSLHPMIQEITMADAKPSIVNCRTLCRSLQEICLLHGKDVSYSKLLFETVETIIALAEKENPAFYLRFLEDVFPYMEKYGYENGMQIVLRELGRLLERESVGSRMDRALLLDYRAACEKKQEKAIKLEKEALELISVVTAENALLAAGLHSNLGGLYRRAGQLELAKEHMKTGISIIEQYGLGWMHDSVPQVCNYAALLCDTGEPENGLAALRKMAYTVKELNSDVCEDYAAIHEAMGTLYLREARIGEGTEALKKAMSIYETIWADDPERIGRKYQEVAAMYPQAGIGIAKRLLGRE